MAIGNRSDRSPMVYFVGLSAKPECEHLAPETRTGHIVEQIIRQLPSIKTVKTNLVRTPPIDPEGNLRYPNPDEMKLGWNELQREMNQTFPNVLVTLGQQVSYFLRSQMGVRPARSQFPADFSYESYFTQSRSYILSVHHPSYVYVYRRKGIEDYVENVVLSILSLFLQGDNRAEPVQPRH